MKSKRSAGFVLTIALLALVSVVPTMAQMRGASKRVEATKITQPESTTAAVYTEDFNYQTGTVLSGQGGWGTHSGTTNLQTIVTPGLTYAGYANSGTGNAVGLTNTGEDTNRPFTSQTTGSVYAAALINVSATQTTGDYFFHLVEGPASGLSFKGRVFAKKDPNSTNFALGIQRSSTGPPTYTSFIYTPGTTYLIIVKFTFVAGAANDVVDLFVNPVIGAVEPAPTVTAGVTADADPVSLDGVALRQGTAGSAATLTLDGIRVGTTWADVTGLRATASNVSVSGRVLTRDGRSVTNAAVMISGETLAQPRAVYTGRNGIYTFDGIEAGHTYVVTVGSQRFTFSNSSMVIAVSDNVSSANFTSDQ